MRRDNMDEYMNDIITVISQYKPGRLIFDELTPYIGFKNLDLLNDVFAHLLETIEEKKSLYNDLLEITLKFKIKA